MGEEGKVTMVETIHDKALRLIEAGAVTIRLQGDNLIDADVHGDHNSYPVVIEIGETERCWCPATGDCSHLLAVVAVALERNTGLPPALLLGNMGKRFTDRLRFNRLGVNA